MKLKEELFDKLAEAKDRGVVKKLLEQHKKELYSNSTEKGALDAIQEKVVSRKLLVFGVATALLYWGAGLDADTWGLIAMTYIGGQTAIDFAKVWRS